jgi:Copper(I)-binding protein CorA
MMRTTKITLFSAVISGLLAASTANAWTTVSPVSFAVNGATEVMTVRAASFSDPKFGYQGWAMHGKWGVFSAEKGRTYRVIVDGRNNPGLHPAVAVWKRPIGTPQQPYLYPNGATVTNLTPANRVPDHNFFPVQSYISSGRSQQHAMESTANNNCTTQWTKTIGGNSVTAPCHEFWKAALRPAAGVTENTGLLLEDGSTDIGMARMLFAAAAYDADKASNLRDDSLNVNPALQQQRDGKAGFVTATFRADETAQYQFFVGGMNPDTGVATDTFLPVSVMLRRN